jgi:hypothetical protein
VGFPHLKDPQLRIWLRRASQLMNCRWQFRWQALPRTAQSIKSPSSWSRQIWSLSLCFGESGRRLWCPQFAPLSFWWRLW